MVQLSRLSGRKTNEWVKAHGSAWKGRHITVRYLLSVPRHPLVSPSASGVFVGTSASLKLDASAVRRNRMRRRCREALRLTVRDRSLPAMQLLLSPRSSSLQCDFRELLDDCARFLSSLS